MKEPLFAVGLFTAGRKHHKKQEGGRMCGGPLRTHFLLHRFSLIKPEHSKVPPLVTECQFTAHYLCICVCVCQRERCVPDLGTFPLRVAVAVMRSTLCVARNAKILQKHPNTKSNNSQIKCSCMFFS